MYQFTVNHPKGVYYVYFDNYSEKGGIAATEAFPSIHCAYSSLSVLFAMKGL